MRCEDGKQGAAKMGQGELMSDNVNKIAEKLAEHLAAMPKMHKQQFCDLMMQRRFADMASIMARECFGAFIGLTVSDDAGVMEKAAPELLKACGLNIEGEDGKWVVKTYKGEAIQTFKELRHADAFMCRMRLAAVQHALGENTMDEPLAPANPEPPADSEWTPRKAAIARDVIDFSEPAPVAGKEAGAGETFQSRVKPWLLACFGEKIANDRQERCHRFIEEALELVQACGATRSECHQLVDYVFDRPKGEQGQELGGVMVTLAALSQAIGFDMHACGEVELKRIWSKMDQIREKQANKPKHSPLPAAPTAETRDEGFEAWFNYAPNPHRRNGSHLNICREAYLAGAAKARAEVLAKVGEVHHKLFESLRATIREDGTTVDEEGRTWDRAIVHAIDILASAFPEAGGKEGK